MKASLVWSGIVLICGAAMAAAPAKPGAPAQPKAPQSAPGSFGDAASLRRAIEHLSKTYGAKYSRGEQFLARLDAIEKNSDTDALESLRREALLANPLLDFDNLLIVRRIVGGAGRPARPIGLPANWQGNCVLPKSGFDNEIAVLPARGGKLRTLSKPAKPVFVGDVDLHFDGTKMLFSSIGDNGRWQVMEIGADGKTLRQVTRGDQPDVDNYDACYLPSGKIVFCSTACMQGVPCVGGNDQVANIYVMEADGASVRQLCFDQDHNWNPVVMNDGRVMFTRWEYSDTPHYFTRILFRMNPDGIGQMALYGSNSYWPNSLFYARPIPGDASKVVAIVSGHHGVARMGELVVLDPAKAQHEADGAVQRIPGYGKRVPPTIQDGLVNGSWPKFLHPYPLSAEFILVAAQPKPGANWGIYLVDTFDNMICIAEEAGAALLEPIPLRATQRPPIIPERVKPGEKEATVYMTDVYRGPGLKGVPRGTVKSLRVFSFVYGYQKLANHTYIGIDGPWDVHRIMGTVPVEADGSAAFKVPANTPIAVQPLDADGRALQLMRSWYTAMPGESISCVGCHERESDAPAAKAPLAARREPSKIEPWLGPARGFSFKREVQPVLDHYCVGCHDGKPTAQARKSMDLRPGKSGNFDTAYVALHPYVRRPGPESDYHLLPPAEYLANTSELIQMLQKGHYGVKLHPEAWQRLYTWIDLNIPNHGTWHEFRDPGAQAKRRCDLRKLYAGMDDDPEAIPPLPPPAFAKDPKPDFTITRAKAVAAPKLDGWPITIEKARALQKSAGSATERTIDLGGGIALQLVLIPAGRFVMGSGDGAPDEAPQSVVTFDRPFWMGRVEITNQQYSLFDPRHDSRVISVFGKDQSTRGIPVNGSTQPVVRVSWNDAMAFCDWLSKRTGQRFALPTEAQWEYACRAGADTPMSYGAITADYSKLANMADSKLDLRARYASNWLLRDAFAVDGASVTAPVGRYVPNAWGLCDMHGNAAEWTLSEYRAYPYSDDDGRNDSAAAPQSPRVVRGGSWYDRAFRCTSSYRLAYPAWQGVYSVGFRVVCAAEGK